MRARNSLGGCGSISEVTGYIHSKYGRERWKDISTRMADMRPESRSSTIPMSQRVLIRVGRGTYCLRDRESALHIQKTRVAIPKIRKKGELEFFSFRNAKQLLEEKDQLKTILAAASLTDLSSAADHNKVQQFLRDSGWNIEVSIFPIRTYPLDAFKNRTGLEIERPLIDAIHRSLFRCIWAYNKKELDILVFLVPTYKEPKFYTVKRDIQAFREIIPYPIYLVGINQP
jgi:hypothetical protein